MIMATSMTAMVRIVLTIVTDDENEDGGPPRRHSVAFIVDSISPFFDAVRGRGAQKVAEKGCGRADDHVYTNTSILVTTTKKEGSDKRDSVRFGGVLWQQS